MKLIRVKSCEGCPFSFYDNANDAGFFCHCGDLLRLFDEPSVYPETIPDWCPLDDAPATEGEKT